MHMHAFFLPTPDWCHFGLSDGGAWGWVRADYVQGVLDGAKETGTDPARAMFNSIDKNGNGHLSRNEVCTQLSHPSGKIVGMEPHRAPLLFQVRDVCETLMLEYSEEYIDGAPAIPILVLCGASVLSPLAAPLRSPPIRAGASLRRRIRQRAV
jgi:hypothetical protein